MKHYPRHIGDFNRATRHLTRIERSIYSDLLDLYYESEKMLPLDINYICRKIIARTNEEVTGVEQVLNEFFTKTPTGYYQDRCEEEIERYQKNNSQQAMAGKASAAARLAKKQAKLNELPTPVQRPFNGASTELQPTINHEPINHEPINHEPINHEESCRDVAIADTAAMDKPKKTKLTSEETEANKSTWAAYATAYKNRYGVEPLRNAQVNGIISKFVKAVGKEDAPSIARYFINISSQFYIQKLHTVKLLIADADAIRTQWLTNHTVTTSQARQADTMQTAKSAVDGVLERRAKRQAEAQAMGDIINGECTHV